MTDDMMSAADPCASNEIINVMHSALSTFGYLAGRLHIRDLYPEEGIVSRFVSRYRICRAYVCPYMNVTIAEPSLAQLTRISRILQNNTYSLYVRARFFRDLLCDRRFGDQYVKMLSDSLGDTTRIDVGECYGAYNKTVCRDEYGVLQERASSSGNTQSVAMFYAGGSPVCAYSPNGARSILRRAPYCLMAAAETATNLTSALFNGAVASLGDASDAAYNLPTSNNATAEYDSVDFGYTQSHADDGSGYINFRISAFLGCAFVLVVATRAVRSCIKSYRRRPNLIELPLEDLPPRYEDLYPSDELPPPYDELFPPSYAPRSVFASRQTDVAEEIDDSYDENLDVAIEVATGAIGSSIDLAAAPANIERPSHTVSEAVFNVTNHSACDTLVA
jgi:hypothetical protein